MIRVLLVLAALLCASVLVAPVASAQTTWLCRPCHQDPCGGTSALLPVLPTASWGLHLLDMTVAQDDLVAMVRSRSSRRAVVAVSISA